MARNIYWFAIQFSKSEIESECVRLSLLPGFCISFPPAFHRSYLLGVRRWCCFQLPCCRVIRLSADRFGGGGCSVRQLVVGVKSLSLPSETFCLAVADSPGTVFCLAPTACARRLLLSASLLNQRFIQFAAACRVFGLRGASRSTARGRHVRAGGPGCQAASPYGRHILVTEAAAFGACLRDHVSASATGISANC